MKKKLFYLSILFTALWVLGFFVMDYSSAVHTMLWLAVIIFIRSLFVCNPGNDVTVEKGK